MGTYQLIFCVILFGYIYLMARLGIQYRQNSERLKKSQGTDDDRLARIESRLQNLETLVVERDRKAEYDRL